MPVLGTRGNPYQPAGSWQFNYGYRYQKSDRHFVGDHEEKDRQAEHAEVINVIHLMDFGITHAFTERFGASLSLPVLFATRSTPVRSPSGENRGEIITRDLQRTDDIGDLVLLGSMWLLDPAANLDKNLQLSLGPKFPTGEADVVHRATVRNGRNLVRETQTVDQSIQPGDDSFGAVVAVKGFYSFLDNFTLFTQGVYLFNPRNTNGVPTFRGIPGEEVMSVTDAYLGKIGVAMPIPWLGDYGLSFSIAARIEGIPVRDVFGPDDGFRRPGYAISVEPGISWTWREHTFGLSAPVPFYRNRLQSVPEKESTPERHGDAAFADYLILFSYSYRFGGGETHVVPQAPELLEPEP